RHCGSEAHRRTRRCRARRSSPIERRARAIGSSPHDPSSTAGRNNLTKRPRLQRWRGRKGGMGVAMGSGSRLRIGVVGTGVAGLSAAWLLSRRHDVIVYEKADRIGGHSNTVLAPLPEGEIPVDTGFIVFNPKTYP